MPLAAWQRCAGRDRPVYRSAVVCCSLLGACGGAQGAELDTPATPSADTNRPGVEELVVTARRRDELAQDIPLSLTVASGAEIEATRADTLVRLQRLDPSLYVVAANQRQASISIRGLGGTIGLANDGLEGGVGVFVDQVYLGRPGPAMFELVDIERVEILHGPQGTLFGRNTTAGAISIATKPPRLDRSETIVEASAGDYGFHQIKTSASGPLTDKVAGRISVSDTHRDGFQRNVTSGEDVQDFDGLTARGQLLVAPLRDVEIRLIADYARQEQHCCTWVSMGVLTTLDSGAPVPDNFLVRSARIGYTPLPFAPFEREVDADSPLAANMDQHGLSVQVDWSLAGAELTSITAYRDWDWDPRNDGDDIARPVFTAFQQVNRQHQVSQEVRIASEGERRFDYVAGIYHFEEVVDGVATTTYGPAAPGWFIAPAANVAPALAEAALNGFGTVSTSSPETHSDALFGTGIWHLTTSLDLSAGLRFTDERRAGGYTQEQVTGASLALLSASDAATVRGIRNNFGANTSYSAQVEDDSLSGDATLSYRTNEGLLGFVTLSHGHKAGGLSIGSLPPGVDPAVAPETTDHVEVGIKGALFDGSVAFGAALYQSNVDDYQTAVVQTSPINGRLLQYISNIDEVRSRGGELDLTWSPSDRFWLNATVAHIDAEYVSFPNGPCPVEVSVTAARCDLSGRPLAGAPKRSWSLAAAGRQPLSGSTELYWRVDYSQRSAVYTAVNNSRYSRVEAYGLSNVGLGVRRNDGRWDAALWINNVLDEDYFNLSAVRSTGWIAGMPGDPRTMGLTFRGRY